VPKAFSRRDSPTGTPLELRSFGRRDPLGRINWDLKNWDLIRSIRVIRVIRNSKQIRAIIP